MTASDGQLRATRRKWQQTIKNCCHFTVISCHTYVVGGLRPQYSLIVSEFGPCRTCTLYLRFDTVRKVGEEVESYLGLDLINSNDIVRVGRTGISLMLEPEPDCAGIGDGFAAPLHLQDRLPVIVRYRDLGRNSAAAQCCEIGDRFASSYRLIAWTRSYVEGVTGSGDCPKAILERIPYPAVEPVLKLRSLIGHIVGLGVHRVI